MRTLRFRQDQRPSKVPQQGLYTSLSTGSTWVGSLNQHREIWVSLPKWPPRFCIQELSSLWKWARIQKRGTPIKLYYKSIRTEVGDKDMSQPEPQVPGRCQKIRKWSMPPKREQHHGQGRWAEAPAWSLGAEAFRGVRGADQLYKIGFGRGEHLVLGSKPTLKTCHSLYFSDNWCFQMGFLWR